MQFLHTYISICTVFVISSDQILFLFFCWIVFIQHSRAAYAHSYHAFAGLARPGSPCSFPHIESANLFDHPISSVSMYVSYPRSAVFDVQCSVRFNRIIPFSEYSFTIAEEKSTLYRYCRFVYIYYIDMFIYIFVNIYFLHISRDIWREIKAYNRLEKKCISLTRCRHEGLMKSMV